MMCDLSCLASFTQYNVLDDVSPSLTKPQNSPRVTSKKITDPPRFMGRRHRPHPSGEAMSMSHCKERLWDKGSCDVPLWAVDFHEPWSISIIQCPTLTNYPAGF